MPILLRRVPRDIRSYWAQFVSVFLMTVLSVAVYGGLDASWRGMQNVLDEIDAQASMPTLWVNATSTTTEDVTALQESTGVDGVARTTQFTVLDENSSDDDRTLTVSTLSDSGVGEPIVLSGDPVEQDGDGIWVDARYADVNGYEVGDELLLRGPQGDASLELRGLVVLSDALVFTGPGLVAPEPSEFGRALVADRVAQEVFGVPQIGNVVTLTGDEGPLRDAVGTVLADRVQSVTDRSSNAFVAPAFERVSQLRSLSFLFSTLFVLVALLAMATSIRRLVDIQHTDIATLRALGMSPRAIGLYFVWIAAGVVGAGAAIGLALAVPLAEYIVSTQQTRFTLGPWGPGWSWATPAVAVGLVVVCVVGAWTASRAARRVSPAEALRPSIGGRASKNPSRPRQWRWAGYGTRWTLRDALGNPVRLTMGLVATTGCMMLLFAGFGIPDSLFREVQRTYSDQYRYETWISVRPGATADELAAVEAAAGPGQWIMQAFARVEQAEGADRVAMVIGDGELVVVENPAGARVDFDQPSLTQAVTAAGVQVGDEVTVVIGDSTVHLTAADEAVVANPQGVLVSEDAWTSAGGVFTPTAYLAEEAVTAEDVADATAVVGTVSRERQRANADSVVQGLAGVFTLMKVFAVLLAAVALYNLGALSFAERVRDYATLRVLGFRQRELRRFALIENGLTTLVGLGIGIPAGFWFLSAYIQIFSTEQSVYAPYISLWSVLFAIATTAIAALSTTILLSSRIRRIDMTAALKGVE
ncbi:FtsX-like permease family protein [Microbacterium sp.]|uniref:ABC transporter permease n=1 Tax=Microbacterium sp. TaxID=51671 RepID=UPI003C74BE74